MLIKNLSLLVVLFLPFLLRHEVLTKSLYLVGHENPAVEHTVERREGIFHRERVWHSIAVRDLTSLRLLSAPSRCSDPFGRCEARITLSFPSLSSLELRVAAITDSHQENRILECERVADGDLVKLLCGGEIPSGVTVRGVTLLPSTIDKDPTFNRIRMDPQTLSWSPGSQVAILGILIGIGALLIGYSLQTADAAAVVWRLAQGYAGMFALSCALHIPRVCRPGFGANAIDTDGRRYYLMTLSGTSYHVMLTLGEHVLVCGATAAILTFPVMAAIRRARATGHPLRVLDFPVYKRDVGIFLGLMALLFPIGMGLYPRALTDIWALALSSISCVLLYNLLSTRQTEPSGAPSSLRLSAKSHYLLGGFLIVGVTAVALGHSAIFFGQPLLADSRVPLVYAHSLLSGVIAPSLDDVTFNIMGGYILIRDGMWFPIQPPGHLGLLMVSSIIGLGGIPGLLGFCVSFALLVALAKALRFSNPGLYTTVALFVTSPIVVLMHAEYMNHISAVIFLLVALLGAYRAVEPESHRATWWMVVFGAASGAMAVTRPLTAIGMLSPIAIWLMARPHLRRFREWGCALAAASPFLIMYLVYNKVTTGSYLVSGYEASYGTSHNPGFGVDPQGESFSLGRGFGRMIAQFGSLSSNALIVPIPLFLVALIGYHVPRLRPVLASAIGLPLAYLFYWHDGGPFFSPRFLFESIPLWCLVIGGCVSTVALERWESITPARQRAIFAVWVPLITFIVAVNLLFPVSDTLLFYKTAAAQTDVS